MRGWNYLYAAGMKTEVGEYCKALGNLWSKSHYGGAFRKYPLTLVRLKLTSVPLPSTPVNTQFHPAKIQVGN